MSHSLMQQFGINLRSIAWLIVGVFVLGASYWLKSALTDPPVKAIDPSPKPIGSSINTDVRVYAKDKTLLYRFTAQQATHFSLKKGTSLVDVTAALHEHGRQTWQITSKHAHLSHNLQVVMLRHNVIMTETEGDRKKGALQLTTQNLTYDNSQSLITGSSQVNIRRGASRLQSHGLRYDTKAEHLSLSNGVTGYYE